jgi:hypothetical protein
VKVIYHPAEKSSTQCGTNYCASKIVIETGDGSLVEMTLFAKNADLENLKIIE